MFLFRCGGTRNPSGRNGGDAHVRSRPTRRNRQVRAQLGLLCSAGEAVRVAGQLERPRAMLTLQHHLSMFLFRCGGTRDPSGRHGRDADARGRPTHSDRKVRAQVGLPCPASLAVRVARQLELPRGTRTLEPHPSMPDSRCGGTRDPSGRNGRDPNAHGRPTHCNRKVRAQLGLLCPASLAVRVAGRLGRPFGTPNFELHPFVPDSGCGGTHDLSGRSGRDTNARGRPT